MTKEEILNQILLKYSYKDYADFMSLPLSKTKLEVLHEAMDLYAKSYHKEQIEGIREKVSSKARSFLNYSDNFNNHADKQYWIGKSDGIVEILELLDQKDIWKEK